MNILFFSVAPYEEHFFRNANDKNHQVVFFSEKLSCNAFKDFEDIEAISICSRDECSAQIMKYLKTIGLKLILLRTAGFDNVDLEMAKELNIRVARVPSYSPEAIAEHAIALILNLSRKISKSQEQISNYNFSLEALMGFNLSEKTVGVIGTGLIGKALIRILKGFGSKILAHDILEDKDLLNDPAVEYTTKAQLLESSDIVTLNIPFNEKTFHYLDFDEIELMKKGAILINTARGKVLNSQALIYGINSGILMAAGIDVYENEKPYFFRDCSDTGIDDEILKRLIACPKVTLTGHQAYFTETALENISEITFQNIDTFLSLKESPNFLA